MVRREQRFATRRYAMGEIQGGAAEARDANVDRQLVALITRPFEDEIHRHGRRAHPHLRNHVVAPRAERREEILDRAERRIEELLGVDAQGKPIVREIEPD